MNEITIAEYNKEKDKPIGLLFMEDCLKKNKQPFANEYKFCETRKFKSDIMFGVRTQVWLAEYEGLPLKGKRSRHVSITGYSKDCEKYNLAVLMGYKVLRYTALNYKEFENDLSTIINKK